MGFEKYAKVRYRTPKAGRTGAGKVVDIIETVKGRWYEVLDATTGARIRLRAANIERAA